MKTETISIQAEGGAFGGYLALPDRPNGNAMVILHEIFGVNEPVRTLARRYAEDGYVTIAPDMLWRLEPGLDLGYTREETLRAMSIVKNLDLAQGVKDLSFVLEALRRHTNVDGKVGMLGLCIGGTLAFLAASQLPIDAAVSFYGTALERHLETVPRMHCPIALHYGGKDRFIPSETVAGIADALAAHQRRDVHVYPEGDHGFYTRGKPEDIALEAAKSSDLDAAAVEIVGALRAAKQSIPGFGHDLHKPNDPRAIRLIGYARELGTVGRHVAALEAVRRAIPKVYGRELALNISGATPAVLLDAGFPASAMKGIALVGRTASLVTHLLEESAKPIGFTLSAAAAAAISYEGAYPNDTRQQPQR